MAPFQQVERYTITLPVADNQGNPVPATHAFLARQLLAAFGGFTAQDVVGRWRAASGIIECGRCGGSGALAIDSEGIDLDYCPTCHGAGRYPGTRDYQDQSVAYIVDTDDPDAERIIRNLAIEARKDAGQEAIYVTRHPVGTVLITDADTPNYTRPALDDGTLVSFTFGLDLTEDPKTFDDLAEVCKALGDHPLVEGETAVGLTKHRKRIAAESRAWDARHA